jgi:hypothetical protein
MDDCSSHCSSIVDDDVESSFGISVSVTKPGLQTKENERIGQEETKVIFKLRLLVFLVLSLAALAVSLSVYYITKNAEDEEFKASFEGNALKVIESFEEIVGQKLGALASLGVAFTSFARSHNQTWPFVTMNDFQERAASTRSLSESLFFELLPIVTNKDRAAWEKYSLKNMGWLAEGRAYQEKFGLGNHRSLQAEESKNMEDELDFSTSIGNIIYSLDETWSPIVDPGFGPYSKSALELRCT